MVILLDNGGNNKHNGRNNDADVVLFSSGRIGVKNAIKNLFVERNTSRAGFDKIIVATKMP